VDAAVRRAVRAHRRSLLDISGGTGIPLRTLQTFLSGRVGVSRRTLNVLVDYLRLKVVPEELVIRPTLYTPGPLDAALKIVDDF